MNEEQRNRHILAALRNWGRSPGECVSGSNVLTPKERESLLLQHLEVESLINEYETKMFTPEQLPENQLTPEQQQLWYMIQNAAQRYKDNDDV